LSITEGAKLHYRFETSPVMDVIEPKDLIIEDVEQQEVSEEDIENVVEDFLLRESTWTPVEGRGAKDGDFVEVDIDIVSEPARNVCTNEKMKIEPKMMPKWLTKLLHGMKPGETKEGETEDENPSHQDECHDEKCTDKHHHHKHDFKPANVRVHLHLIQQPVKPALDDEFVKKYGAENVEDLRAKVKISLENKAAGAKRDRQRALMQQALLAKYRFEIPASRLKSDIKARTEQSIQELMQHAKEHGGYDDEKIAAEKKMIALFHEERCKEEFRLILLLSQVLRRNQLKVTPEEVNMKYLESLWMQRMGADIHLSEKEQEAKSQIEMKLSMERALDFLIDFTR
jgi:trigger factor